MVMLRGIVGVGLLSAGVAWIIWISSSSTDAAIGILALSAYCVLGAAVTPRPDYNDVGWLGGLVNNPFRLSDNVNRWLIFLGVVLWPGRFISTSVRDLVCLASGRRTIVLPPRDEDT